MRLHTLLSSFPVLLLSGIGIARGQSTGNAVILTSPGYFDEYLGTYAAFSFAWGNGSLLSSDGSAASLLFDGMMHEAHDGLLKSLQSTPFTLDKSKTSVEFDVGYRFLVEARARAKEPMDQGVMILDLELYDVNSGQIHPRYVSLSDPFSISVPPGENCDETAFCRLSMEVDPAWVASGSRQVVLRVVFNISPGSLMRTPDVSIAETVSGNSLHTSIK